MEKQLIEVSEELQAKIDAGEELSAQESCESANAGKCGYCDGLVFVPCA